MTTILLRDGKIIDGTGSAAYDGSLLIEDDKIKAVLKKGEEPPSTDAVVDATGCVISPGFIDMHSHSDWLIPLDDHHKLLKHSLEQGITTIVAGNCGFSPAPIGPGSSELIAMMDMLREKPLDYSWKSMGEFLDRVEEEEPVLNLAELTGHASVRLAVSPERRGGMSPEDLKKSLDELRRSFDEGACGLSLGLMYDPGLYSPLEEIEAFCRVAAKADKPVAVHLKALSVLSPGYPLTTMRAHNHLALEEMIDIARKTEAKLQISHLIFVGRRSFSTAPKALRMIEQARREGVDVMFDGFPYPCGNTTVNVVLPYWFLAKTPDAYRDRWARAKLRAEMEIGFRLVGFMYKDFQVMNAAIEGAEELNGYTVEEISKKWKMSPFNAMLKLSEESKGGTLMLFHTYSGEPGNEKALESVLEHELCLFETDAALRSEGYPNPAAVGTFPRVLGPLVRDRKLFSLENAINRSTLASAERFAIKDRGAIATGKAADVVIFDPEEISDTPPVGNKPAGKPKGIKHVFVNGAHVVKDGSYVGGPRPGRVLRV